VHFKRPKGEIARSRRAGRDWRPESPGGKDAVCFLYISIINTGFLLNLRGFWAKNYKIIIIFQKK